MAYANNIRSKFIEMCARGITMSEISRKLKISLPTLDNWKEETTWEVFEFEKMLDKEKVIENNKMITERVKLLNTELEKAYKALEKRTVNKMKAKNLLFFIERLESEFDDPLLINKVKPEKKRLRKVNTVYGTEKKIETKIIEETMDPNRYGNRKGKR